MSRLVSAVVMSAASVLVAVGSAAAEATIEIVAFPGQAPAGVPDGQVLRPGDRARVSIDNLGRVLFSSDVAQGLNPVGSGYFAWRGGTPEAVILRGDTIDPVGGVGAGSLVIATIDDAFTTPIGLHVVFLPTAVLRSRNGGGFDAITATGPIAHPGACPIGSYFAPAGAARAPLRVADDANAAFVARDLRGDGCDYGEKASGGSTDGSSLLLRQVSTDNFASLVVNAQTELPSGDSAGINGNSTLRLGPEGHLLFRASAGGDALLLADPVTGALTIVVRVGDPAPGTGETILRVDDFTLGPTDGGGVRVAYSVRVAGSGDVLVYDTGIGAGAPLFRTGDVIDGFTFAPDPASSLPQLAIADERLVVVAEGTGAGTLARSDAVWRVTMLEDGLERDVIARSGSVIDAGGGLEYDVSVIHETIVSPDGHVAIVASLAQFGLEAILMEGVSVGSGLIPAVVTGDNMPSPDESPRFAGDLTPVNPPRLVQPGHDGRPARLNDDGVLVFNAAAKTQFANGDFGVFTVTVREVLEDSDVRVTGKRGRFRITGDDGDAKITIELDDDGDLVVIPGDRTTINGERSDFATNERIRSVFVDMGPGNDVVKVRPDALGDMEPWPGDLTIHGGPGNDDIDVRDVVLARSLSIASDAGATEFLRVIRVDVGRDLTVTGAEGSTIIDLTGVDVDRRTRIRTADNVSGSFTALSCDFGKVAFQAGNPGGSAGFRRCNFDGNAKFTFGDGDLHRLSLLDNTRFDGAAAKIQSPKAGFLLLLMRDVSGLRKLSIGGGPGDDQLELDRVAVAGKLSVSMGGNGGERTGNRLSTSGLAIQGNCTISGDGVSSVVMTNAMVGGALAVRFGKGELADVSLLRPSVEGRTKITSRASATSAVITTPALENAVSIATGAGADLIRIAGGDVLGALTVKTREGDDEVEVTDTNVEKLNLDGGGGSADTLTDTANVEGKRKVRGFER